MAGEILTGITLIKADYADGFVELFPSAIADLFRYFLEGSVTFGLLRVSSMAKGILRIDMKTRIHRTLLLIGLLFFVLSLSRDAVGQWVQSNGPYGGYVEALTVSGSNLLCGTDNGLFISSDSAKSWNQTLSGEATHALASLGSEAFAVTNRASYYSRDSGITWESAGNGLIASNVVALGTCDSDLFACSTYQGILRSFDSGRNWSSINAGFRSDSNSVSEFASIGSNLFAATYGHGVFRTDDNGDTWDSASRGLTNLTVTCLVANASTLFAGTQGSGVFASVDSGGDWNPVNRGLPQNIGALVIGRCGLLAETDSGLFRSTDEGMSWESSSKALTSTHIHAFCTNGSTFFAGGGNPGSDGMFRSTDSGVTWVATSEGLGLGEIQTLTSMAGWLYAGSWGSGFFSSNDNGNSWSSSLNGLGGSYVLSLQAIGKNLFIGTPDAGIFRSSDSGHSWFSVDSGLANNDVWCIAGDSAHMFIGTYGGGVYVSANSGESWLAVDSGLGGGESATIYALLLYEGNLFVSTDSGVYRSTNNGISWMPSGSGLGRPSVSAFAAIDGRIFAVSNSVYGWKDSGSQWAPTDTGFTNDPNFYVWNSSFLSVGPYLFLGTERSGILISTDGGSSWNSTIQGPFPTFVYALATCDSDLFAATSSGVWRRPLSEMIPPAAVKESIAPEITVQAFPNPFPSQTRIHFATAEPGFARVSVVNLLGEEVARLYSGTLSTGEHSFDWNASNAPAGTYFCLIQTAVGREVVSVRHE